MSALQKGGLTVLVSTIIASVLILLIGNSVKGENKIDSNTLAENNNSDLLVTKDTSLSSASKLKVSEPIATVQALATSDGVGEVSGGQGNDLTVLPPPGPFIEASGLPKIADSLNLKRVVIPLAPVSPKAPVQSANLIKKPMPLINPSRESTVATLVKPKALFSPTIENIKLQKPNLVENNTSQPELSRTIEAPIAAKERLEPKMNRSIGQPNAPINTSKIPLLITNSKSSLDLPTWMKREPNIPFVGNQPQKPANQNINFQIQDMSKQRYMVVPAPMFAPTNGYPQVPVYGGAYYYAPLQPQQLLNEVMMPLSNNNNLTQPIYESNLVPNQGSVQ